MALDPGLAFRIQGPQIEPREQALMRALQLVGAQRQNALSSMQMRAFEQAQQQAQAQQNALSAFRQQMPSPQMEAAQNALAAQPNPAAGPTRAAAGMMAPVDPRMQAEWQMLQAGGSPRDYLAAKFPKPEYGVAGPGAAVFNKADGRVQSQVPFKPETPDPNKPFMLVDGKAVPNPAYQEYARGVARAGATSVSYGAPQPGVDEKGNPVFFQPARGGGAPAIVPGVRPAAKEEKPLTEGQAKAVLFSSRMQAADKVLADLARKGTSTTIPGATKNSVIGDVITAASPAQQQQLVQAKRDFVNAVLRRESGAVISPEEFANAERQYFPQIGDSRPVIEQKARNRRAAIEGMRADVPANRQSDVDRISGGERPSADNDPLGLRGQ